MAKKKPMKVKDFAEELEKIEYPKHEWSHICSKCWGLIKNENANLELLSNDNVKKCKCKSKRKIQIDNRIFIAVQNFNLKGYNTMCCCGGDDYYPTSHATIIFKQQYDFKTPYYDSFQVKYGKTSCGSPILYLDSIFDFKEIRTEFPEITSNQKHINDYLRDIVKFSEEIPYNLQKEN